MINDQPPPLPSGTVTFLFTDVAGSTALLKQLGEPYVDLLANQRRILRAAFDKWGGREVDTQGDSFFVSFPRASETVVAAVAIQRALAEFAWPEGVEVRVRMGLHTGEPWVAEEGYVGIDVHRAARIAHIGHGGQILLSEATAGLVRDALPLTVHLEELGVYHLKDLPRPELVSQLVIEGLPGKFPPLKASKTHTFDLPGQPTPFVGRQNELAALDNLLAVPDNRLVSIVGAGGAGKTRLALAVAERLAAATAAANGNMRLRYPQGAYFAPLAPLSAPNQIIPSIAEALGFRFMADEADQKRSPRQQLLDYLRRRRLLLVLDNFEHLLDGVSVVTDILNAAPSVQVLATSREPLRLHEEQLFPLEGMAYPDITLLDKEPGFAPGDFSALILFCQCARRVVPDYLPIDNDWQRITRICHLVAGMPLGVELAASWLEAISLAEIAAEIQKSLDFLASDHRNLPVRHRSMRAVFNSTWERLSPAEQTLFQGLSIFRGGFTTAAARRVAGADLARLKSLTQKSILSFDRQASRYHIHELLRQYGVEKLQANPETVEAARDRHAAYYCGELGKRTADLKGPRQVEAQAEIEADLDNALAAWRWASERLLFDSLAKALEPLGLFLDRTMRYEVAEQAIQLASERLELQENKDALRLRAMLITWTAWFIPLERGLEALDLLKTGEDILQHPALLDEDVRADKAFLLWELGSRQESWVDGLQTLEQALELYQSTDNQWAIANLLHSVGTGICTTDNLSQGLKYLKQSLAIRRKIADLRGIANSISQLSWMGLYGELYPGAEAEDMAQESLRLNQKIGNRVGEAESLLAISEIRQIRGNFQGALRPLNKYISIWEDLGYSFHWGYFNISYCYASLGQYQQAAEYAQVSLDRAIEGKRDLLEARSYEIAGTVALALKEYKIAENYLNLALERLEVIELISALALTYALLGILECALDGLGQAQHSLARALAMSVDLSTFWANYTILAGIAYLFAKRGDIARAVELYALCSRSPFFGKSCWFHDVIGVYIEDAAKQILEEEILEAQNRGKMLDWNETIKSLYEEFISLEQSTV